MKTSKLKIALSNVAFIVFFVFSCFFMANSQKMPSIFNDSSLFFIFAKSLLPFALTTIGTLICFRANKTFYFLSVFAPTIIILQTVFFTVDRYTSRLYGTSQIVLGVHIFYLFVALFSLFLCCFLINKKRHLDSFKIFTKRFMVSFLICYIALVGVFMLRTPNLNGFSTSINLSLGKDTIKMFKSFISLGDIESGYVFFGNIAFFIPFGILLPYYSRRKHIFPYFIWGILVPIFYEAYQYLFNCGDVDIDDIFLNFIGFIIGFSIFCLMGGRKLEKGCNMVK